VSIEAPGAGGCSVVQSSGLHLRSPEDSTTLRRWRQRHRGDNQSSPWRCSPFPKNSFKNFNSVTP